MIALRSDSYAPWPHTWKIVSILLILIATSNLAVLPAFAFRHDDIDPKRTQKAVMVDSAYVVGGLAGQPSFVALSLAGFQIVGTGADPAFQSRQWTILRNWIQEAHAAGLGVFINLSGDGHNLSTVIPLIQLAATERTDIIALDEILSTYNVTRQQLQLLINAGLKVNPKLEFFINEFTQQNIENAYAWTANYSAVRIATDNYDNKTIIDLGINLAAHYGKKPITWLIFAKGSRDFNCYGHLASWLAYVKLRHLDVLFWAIDPNGTWRTQWALVSDF